MQKIYHKPYDIECKIRKREIYIKSKFQIFSFLFLNCQRKKSLFYENLWKIRAKKIFMEFNLKKRKNFKMRNFLFEKLRRK